MSHGSGLVRTTCSSGGASGPGQPSEGSSDRVYPLTHGASFKVAQMAARLAPGSGEGESPAIPCHLQAAHGLPPERVELGDKRARLDFRISAGDREKRRLSDHRQVTSSIAFICVRSSVPIDYGAHSFFEVVTMCDSIMILIFYSVHLFRFYRVLTCISWPSSESSHYLIGTSLLLIASIVIASKSYNQSGSVAGAIFGFSASFLCLASLWSSYKITCITQSSDASA